MSYRELRNFAEMMRTLGCPRIISVENFRTPNFELVAEILFWMVKMYDPESNISDRVEFESERVEFLTSIEALMASKARLKLNTKKLYAADGRAVQEMSKISSLLYSAIQLSSKSSIEDTSLVPIKLQDVKTVRSLASDITQSGAKLFDILETEANDRQERLKSLRFLDVVSVAPEGSREHNFVEKSLREVVEMARQKVEDVKKECEELEADEKNIKNKITRKQEELERTEKRLRSIDSVRPQFMEEVDKLEQELAKYYEIYMDKYRNLDYLENELEMFRKQEEERVKQKDARMTRMMNRILKKERDDFMKPLYDEDVENEKNENKTRKQTKKSHFKNRGKAKANSNSRNNHKKHGSATIEGNILGPDESESEEEDEEEEDIQEDDDDDNNNSDEEDDDDEDEDEVSLGSGIGDSPTGISNVLQEKIRERERERENRLKAKHMDEDSDLDEDLLNEHDDDDDDDDEDEDEHDGNDSNGSDDRF